MKNKLRYMLGQLPKSPISADFEYTQYYINQKVNQYGIVCYTPTEYNTHPLISAIEEDGDGYIAGYFLLITDDLSKEEEGPMGNCYLIRQGSLGLEFMNQSYPDPPIRGLQEFIKFIKQKP